MGWKLFPGRLEAKCDTCSRLQTVRQESGGGSSSKGKIEQIREMGWFINSRKAYCPHCVQQIKE